MRHFFFAAFVLCVLFSCVTEPSDKNERILHQRGFTDVRITGTRSFGCRPGYDQILEFSALSPRKQRVTGVLCRGWMKGAAVHID